MRLYVALQPRYKSNLSFLAVTAQGKALEDFFGRLWSDSLCRLERRQPSGWGYLVVVQQVHRFVLIYVSIQLELRLARSVEVDCLVC